MPRAAKLWAHHWFYVLGGQKHCSEVETGSWEYNGPTGMHTDLRISTASTIVASTYSLFPSVQDAPSRKGSGHTRMNNAKTGV